MPQVLLFAALGAVAYAGFRALSRAAGQFAAELERGADAARQRTRASEPADQIDGGTLEFDPVSGVYKPRQR